MESGKEKKRKREKGERVRVRERKRDRVQRWRVRKRKRERVLAGTRQKKNPCFEIESSGEDEFRTRTSSIIAIEGGARLKKDLNLTSRLTSFEDGRLRFPRLRSA
jgi:hypothetical protein